MDDKIIDTYYKDENKQYYTLYEVSEILQLEQSRIIYYYKKLNDFLNITSIGMYQVFEQNDIDNIQVIKELNIDKNMSISDIKQYLETHKQEVLFHKDKQEIDITNKSFANFLIKVLNNQNQKIDVLIEHGTKTLEAIDKMNKNQEELKNEVTSLTDEISSIKNEMKTNNEILEKENVLRQRQLERKQEFEKSQPKSLISKLFNFKKQ